MRTSLRDFWPSEEHCRECLINEAETASDAVFLAVHQPMRLSRRLLHTPQSEGEEKQEADLLHAFLTENLSSGTLLLPIVGNSGVGKSHMIRWLDAHLRRRENGVKRHIVRIPKSASLRRVLELILERLPEERYGTLRKELTSARMPPDLQQATHGLREKLLVALERTFQEAKARLLERRPRSDDRARMSHCDLRGLPALLEDPEIKAHFMAYEGDQLGVLARIASRCMQGAHAQEGPLNQFTEDDLDLGGRVDLAAVANSTRQYLNTLNRQDGQHRREAVGFLNDVVDKALAELLDFRGHSLTDLFVKMREQLLKDEMELVLLVEDFAALAGIQGSLLDAMIREGIRSGKKELCTMRTALAVTEGYLANRETVMTRAQFEWRIEDRPFTNPAQAIDTFTNFVGGYLNAARWGKTRLDREFERRSDGDDDLQHWLPNFFEQRKNDVDPESLDVLEQFGVSSRGGHPLFPFNQGVIRQLAKRYLQKGDSFIFNPRDLINRMLRDTLLDNRPLFEAGSFPPGNFHQFARQRLAIPVERELEQRADPTHLDRLGALVYHWGDDPQFAGEAASIPEAVYRAFKLTPVNWSAPPEPRTQPPPPDQKRPVTQPSPTDRLGPWKEKLQRWRQEGKIGQNDANGLRRLLGDALAEWLDWDALLLKPASIDHKRIFLPKASTGITSQTDALAVAATDDDWKDATRSGQFYGAITAMIRYHEGNKTWNYDGGEADSAAYASLIERMARQAEAYFRRQGHGLNREAVRPLAQALLIGARLLNLPGATANTDAENIAAVFALPPSDDGAIPESADLWAKLRAGARQHREAMRELLLKQLAARQGGGDSVQAVDAASLLEAIRELRKSWLLPTELNFELFRDHPSIKDHLRDLKNFLKSAIQNRRDALSQWRREIVGWLGTDFEVPQVVQDLRQTALEAHQSSVFRCGSTSYESLRDLVKKLEDCRIKDTMDQTEKADQTDPGVVLSAMAQADDRTVEVTRRVFTEYERFLKATDEAADERLVNAPPSLEEEAKKLCQDIETLTKLWKEVEETRP
jgi:hypothetical protein